MISERHIKKYCREDISLIKNYDKAVNDTTEIWECHHINEWTFTKYELIQMNMYYNRPANELIFLTKSEHCKIHRNHCAGETQRNLRNSLTNKGRPSSFKGHKSKYKGCERSDSIKKAISKSCTGRKLIIGPDGKKHWYKEERGGI